ncbi:MAG: OmpA family protein [Pseudomonadota bacterium]
MRWLVAILLVATPGLAMDLPDLLDAGAPDGAAQTARLDKAFDIYPLPVAPFGTGDAATANVEGRVIWTAYRLDTLATTGEVIARYRDWLIDRGFETSFTCMTDGCGGFDFRFEAAILPAPGMLMDVADFRQLTMARPIDGAYASVLSSRVLGAVYIQTVMVLPDEGGLNIVPATANETPTETVFLPQDEKALYDRLVADGHVPIMGLHFETGGATLSVQSNEAISLLARLLNRNDIAVVIVGHSDNQGALASNRDLSRRRAQAVMKALEERGVASAQMSAEGIGFLAPIASNATEEGRGLNRRVELVLQ